MGRGGAGVTAGTGVGAGVAGAGVSTGVGAGIASLGVTVGEGGVGETVGIVVTDNRYLATASTSVCVKLLMKAGIPEPGFIS